MVNYNGHKIKKSGDCIVIDGKKKEISVGKLLYENRGGQIFAYDGADGLYKFIKELKKKDKTGMWINSIINGVMQ